MNLVPQGTFTYLPWHRVPCFRRLQSHVPKLYKPTVVFYLVYGYLVLLKNKKLATFSV